MGNNEAQGRTLGIAAQGPTLYWGGRLLHKCATVALVVSVAFADFPFGIFEVPKVEASATMKRTYLTTGDTSPWTVPDDWNSAANTSEVIGSGG